MHAAIGTAATHYLYRCTGQLFETGLDLGLYRMSIWLNLPAVVGLTVIRNFNKISQRNMGIQFDTRCRYPGILLP